MKSKSFVIALLFVVFCTSIFALAKAQEPHKSIDDYLKAYERLIEYVEELNPAIEQDFPLLAQKSQNFNATAQSLQASSEWTKNDSAMLDILNERYTAAVTRLVSGNMANGYSVAFN